ALGCRSIEGFRHAVELELRRDVNVEALVDEHQQNRAVARVSGVAGKQVRIRRNGFEGCAAEPGFPRSVVIREELERLASWQLWVERARSLVPEAGKVQPLTDEDAQDLGEQRRPIPLVVREP